MISPFYQKHKSKIRVHIFKTNIKTASDVNVIKNLLDLNPKVSRFSIDLEDVDKVLRIESSKKLSEKDLIEEVKSKGFMCGKLD